MSPTSTTEKSSTMGGIPGHDNFALLSVGSVISLQTSSDPRYPIENILDGFVKEKLISLCENSTLIKSTIKTFWITTGLAPQEFVLTFPFTLKIKKIVLWSAKVASWSIEKSVNEKPQDFEPVGDLESEDADSHLQVSTMIFPTQSLNTNTTATNAILHAKEASAYQGSGEKFIIARHLKITITKMYNEFCSVHKILASGERM
ncbi:Heat shock protein beta-11 [Nowakowskiella sp. JEL0078]|nr:Heat shock protein beta-11 [Nowakowskiella sp. JEL0078]